MWCGNFFWGWKVAKSMVQAKAWKCIEASPRWRALRSGSYIKQLYITWWRQRRFTQVRVAKRWASCWMHFTHLIPLFPIYLPFGALKCCKGIVRSFARSACTTFVYSTLVALLDSVVQAKSHFLQMHPHLPLCLYYINRLDVAIVGRLEKVLKSSRKGFCLFSRHFRLSSPRTTKRWWCRVSENISVDVCHVYVYYEKIFWHILSSFSGIFALG